MRLTQEQQEQKARWLQSVVEAKIAEREQALREEAQAAEGCTRLADVTPPFTFAKGKPTPMLSAAAPRRR